MAIPDRVQSLSGEEKSSALPVRLTDPMQVWDLAIAVAFTVTMTIVSSVFDLFEHWNAFVEKHEEFQLDEVTTGIFALALALVWYEWRRIKKARVLREIAFVQAREALRANKAKSDFLAAMSHDLRTPLNAIMGFSDMMRARIFGPLGDPHYEEYAEDIYRSGALLISLINDVLDLSKIEAGKYDLADDRIDVRAVIEESFRQLRHYADRSGQTLTMEVPDGFPELNADHRAMMQILNNLLSNAHKFTPDGGRIGVSAALSGDGGIEIAVTDDGIGMSKADIVKALRPFEQARGRSTQRDEGTGLGLFLCSNLMKLSGGDLAIVSDLDKGTTVTVRFPPSRTLREG